MWYSILFVYGPKGGRVGVAKTPHTSVLAKAVSVPEAWSTPLMVIRATRVSDFRSPQG